MSNSLWRGPLVKLDSLRRRWLLSRKEIEARLLIEEHGCYLRHGGEEMRYDYVIRADETVLDLGGYQGDWTNEMVSRFGCQVIVFEPVETYFNVLHERFAGERRVSLCRFGVGERSRLDRISLANDSSSLFKKSNGQGEQVEIRDIADWWDVSLLPDVAVMKVNIEGGEYEVLPRMIETGLISRVKNLQVQFHSFVPDADLKMARITEALFRTHEPTYRFRYIWENWHRREP